MKNTTTSNNSSYYSSNDLYHADGTNTLSNVHNEVSNPPPTTTTTPSTNSTETLTNKEHLILWYAGSSIQVQVSFHTSNFEKSMTTFAKVSLKMYCTKASIEEIYYVPCITILCNSAALSSLFHCASLVHLYRMQRTRR